MKYNDFFVVLFGIVSYNDGTVGIDGTEKGECMIINGQSSVYEQIVAHFKKYISLGVLKPKEKLPSCRKLAIEIGVNLKTVERAYNELINFGLVESIPKKGYFVKDNIDRDKSYAFDIINKLRNDGMKKEVLLCAIEEVYGKENKW